MNPELVVFDLDGTLLDTPRAIVETFGAALAGLGAPPRPAAEIRATIGLPLQEAFGRLLGVPAADPLVAEGVALYQKRFRERVLPRAKELIFPGVAAGLELLRRRGFLLAVATSKFHASAVAVLEAAGLRHEFAMIVGADDVSRPKPDPESGERVMRALGVRPEDAVMVGDTTHDLLMAKAAGMRSVAVTYGVHDAATLAAAGPTFLAGSFEEAVARLGREAVR